MASEVLRAVLEGQDNGLQSALDEVAGAARNASRQLDTVGDELEKISGQSSGASQAVDEAADQMRDAAVSGEAMEEGVEKAGDAASGLTIRVQAADIAIDQVSSSMREAAVSGGAMAEGMDQAEEQSEEAASGFWKGVAGSLGFSGALKELSATASISQAQLDEVADEADDARNSFLEAAGAAQALQLSSSALSINVGFMTVALRNATTQIPALVAGLGNLAAAMIGVAGAAGLAAAGIAGVVAGGLMAEMERLTGQLENTENAMEAMQAIGQELKDMFIEAMQPLINMEGAAEAFKSVMEGLMTTVRAFAEGLRRSFEAGEELFGIKDFMDEVGSAWMNNLEDIIAGFQTIFHNIGPIVSDALQFAIRNFDEFATFVSEVTLDVVTLFQAIRSSAGDFIRSMMELGTIVGSGLVPVLNIFFDVISGIADIISGAGFEVVAMTVKIAGMLLILNKLAGTLSTVVGLLGAVPAVLAEATAKSNSFTGALIRMSAIIKSFISTYVGGIASLGQAITALMPFQLGLIESVTRLGLVADSAGGPLAIMNTLLRSAGDSSLRFAKEQLAASTIVSGLSNRISGLIPNIDSATAAMGRYGRAIGAALRPSNLFNVGTTAMADGLDFMRSKATSASRILTSSLQQAITGAGRSMLLAGKHVSLLGQYISTLANTALRGALTGFINLRYAAIQARLSFNQLATQGVTTALGSLVSLRYAAIQARLSFNQLATQGITTALGSLVSLRYAAIQARLSFNQLATQGITTALSSLVNLRYAAIQARLSFNKFATKAVTTVLGSLIGVRTSLDKTVAKWNRLTATTRKGIPFDKSTLAFFGDDMINADEVLTGFAGLRRRAVRSVSDMGDRLGDTVASFSQRIGWAEHLDPDVLSEIEGPSSTDYSKAVFSGPRGVLHTFSKNVRSTLSSTYEDITALGSKKISELRRSWKFSYIEMRNEARRTVKGAVDSITSIPGRVGSSLSQFSTMGRTAMANFGEGIRGTDVDEFIGDGLETVNLSDSVSGEPVGDINLGILTRAKMRLGGLRDTIGSMTPNLGALSDSLRNAEMSAISLSGAASFVNSGFARMRSAMQASIIPTAALSNGVQALANRMIASGGITNTWGIALSRLNGKLAAGRSLTGALRSSIAALAGVEASASAKTFAYGLATSFASAVTSLFTGGVVALTGVLATLATALGAIVALLGAVVLIGGAVTLALAKLGESGESAESIISGLRDALVRIAEAAMPIFIETANTLMDIINSILAPVGALISGFKDIGVAMGIMEEGAGGGSALGMLVGILKSTVAVLNPVIDMIGDVARQIGSKLTARIQEVTQRIVDFLEASGATEKIPKLIKAIGNAAGPVFSLIKTILSVIVGVIGFAIDMVMGFYSAIYTLINAALGFIGLDLPGVFGGMIDMITKGVQFVGKLASKLETLIKVVSEIANAWVEIFGGAFDLIIAVLTGKFEQIPQILEDTFSGIMQAISGTIGNIWNDAIAGDLLTISVPDWVPKYGGNDWTLSIPPIDTGGGGGDGSGGGGGGSPKIEESSFGMEDVGAGADTASDVAGRAAESVSPGAPATGVEYNEGDTMKQYNQDISADPEDKSQMSRIAKDAMEEANSFARRQQGGQ